MTQDMALISILKQNKWSRPVYFSTTVDSSSMPGLSKYTTMEGSILELKPYLPEKIDPDLMTANLIEKYRYRNFNNSNQSIDRVTANLFNNFRYQFYALIDYYLNSGNNRIARKLFDVMNYKLPPWRFTEAQNAFLNDLAKRMEK